MIGLLSDSHGDLDALDAGHALLSARGARRFFFLGGRFTDVGDWLLRRRTRERGGRAYTDRDFLSDVTAWLSTSEQTERPGAFEEEAASSANDDAIELRSRFSITPERGSLQYLDPTVPTKLMDMLGQSLCCVVHNKNDLTRDDLANATLFLHGAAREPAVVQIGPRYFVTPGALAGAAEQTCGLIDVTDGAPRFTGLRLDGSVLVPPTSLVPERRLPGVKLTVK